MEIPVRNTIFLQGIFFSQVKTIEEHMIEENISQHDVRADELPSQRMNDIRITRFKNKKQWADAYKDATLKCWNCGLSFKGMPCFIPRQSEILHLERSMIQSDYFVDLRARTRF